MVRLLAWEGPPGLRGVHAKAMGSPWRTGELDVERIHGERGTFHLGHADRTQVRPDVPDELQRRGPREGGSSREPEQGLAAELREHLRDGAAAGRDPT